MDWILTFAKWIVLPLAAIVGLLATIAILVSKDCPVVSGRDEQQRGNEHD